MGMLVWALGLQQRGFGVGHVRNIVVLWRLYQTSIQNGDLCPKVSEDVRRCPKVSEGVRRCPQSGPGWFRVDLVVFEWTCLSPSESGVKFT